MCEYYKFKITVTSLRGQWIYQEAKIVIFENTKHKQFKICANFS